jgi:hypothetical protein
MKLMVMHMQWPSFFFFFVGEGYFSLKKIYRTEENGRKRKRKRKREFTRGNAAKLFSKRKRNEIKNKSKKMKLISLCVSGEVVDCCR